jgi:hypothetical protein
MLIRVSGGQEGIKEYLELGHKQGREFSRDELDERVILSGALHFTQQIIDGIEIDGERYLHITLSFKEDEISRETLKAITEDFRAFMFSAYKDDEYSFYAEAHLPKIKSYEHRQTGELVERKPHIHIVIPKVNLRSGGVLNPFGLVERNERHIDALQEHINNKYGLASPKDNRRFEFTDASDIIARYKADDNFAGANKELKNAILAEVIARDVKTFEDFGKLVGELGATKMRNAGRDNEYWNVKLEGEKKGVNLKDYHFSRQFIELPREEKQRILKTEIERKYEVQGEARKDQANIAPLLDEWHRLRAKEVKYLNSGSKKQYRAYRDATLEEREEMLLILEARFYNKYQEPRAEPEGFTGNNPFDPDYGFKQLQSEPQQLSLLEPTESGPGHEIASAGQPGPATLERGLDGPEIPVAGDLNVPTSHPNRRQEPATLAGFEQTRTLGVPDSAPALGKNPVGRDYGVGRHGGDVDQLAGHTDRRLATMPLSAFEQYHSLNQAFDAPTARMQATPAVTFNHQYQERNHEPDRICGKNPVGHEYGFTRPGGGNERNPFQNASGGPTGRERGSAGGYVVGDGRRGAAGPGAAAGHWSGRYPGSANWQHDIIPLAVFEKALTIDRVRGVPGGRMVREGREGAVLLPHHAPNQLGNRPSGSDSNLRRPRHRGGFREVRGTGRVDDSVVSQVARDFGERQRSGAAGRLPEFQEIKLRLDARRLLAELSRSHGVMPDKYQVTQAADGSARIRCGARNLNVADFMTKEMRLPWSEAATILRHSYGRQVDRHPAMPPHMPADRALWRQFQDERRGRAGLRTQLAEQLASERERQDAIKERLVEAKRAAAGLPAGDRKAALSIARMEYITANDALKASIRAERAPFRLPVSDQYRTFLQERAQAGDESALAELRRRTRSAPLRADPAVGYIQPAEGRQEQSGMFYRGRQVHYRVQLDGNVVYSLAGRPVVQDKGDSIVLLQTDRLTIETALRLAEAKFGSRLMLSGPTEFQERAARIAAEAGLDIRFDNKDAEQIRRQRAAELVSQRDAGRRFIEAQTRAQPSINGGAVEQPAGTRSPDKSAPETSPDDPEIER